VNSASAERPVVHNKHRTTTTEQQQQAYLNAALQQALQLRDGLRLGGRELSSPLPNLVLSSLALLLHQDVVREQSESRQEPIPCELRKETNTFLEQPTDSVVDNDNNKT
jgi:hypothetical protein